MDAASGSTLILGTAGHIDHGKTALVRELTGTDTDRLPQEKQRGITIDIGFAELKLPPYELGVVDVPGHERFIKNMLAGATGIDVLLLVVAADDSVMPQTREHLTLCQLLGIPRGVVAITKSDLAGGEQLARVRQDVADLTRGTFLEDAPVVETSVAPPTGIEALRAALKTQCARIQPAPVRDLFRLAVDRSFHQTGHGTVVTGTVASGQVRVDDEVQCMPQGTLLRVRNIHRHGRAVASAGAGQRAAINLASIGHNQIRRGCELATPGYLRPFTHLLAQLHVVTDSPLALKNRGRVRLHLGTQSLVATLNVFDQTTIEPAQTAWAQLICHRPAMCEGGQPVVLRSESPMHTLGGGRVRWASNQRLSQRQWHGIEPTIRSLQRDDAFVRLGAAIAMYGHSNWTTLDLCRDARITRQQAADLLPRAVDQRVVLQFQQRTNQVRHIHHDHWADLIRRAIDLIGRLHQDSPDHARLDRSKVVAALGETFEASLADLIVAQLIHDGELVGDERSVSLKRFQATLTASQQRLLEQVTRLTRDAGVDFLDEPQLRQQTRARPADLQAVLQCAVDRAMLVHLGQGRYIDRKTLDEVIRQLWSAFEQREALTTAEVRDLLNTTRRYALPICEYLDKQQLTRRDGNTRRWIGPTA